MATQKLKQLPPKAGASNLPAIEKTPLPPQLPETGFLRLSQIVDNPKAKPPIPALIPISKTSFWNVVKAVILTNYESGKTMKSQQNSKKRKNQPTLSIRDILILLYHLPEFIDALERLCQCVGN